MSGWATAAAALGWLAVLAVLWRCPIVSVGCVVALILWSVDPVGSLLALVLTAGISLAWRVLGPSERVLASFPELAVALAAGVVAVLAGGQLAAAGLAVLVLALNWFVVVRLGGIIRRAKSGLALPVRAVAGESRSPAPVAGFLGPGALRVDVGVCPGCGGLLIASGRTSVDRARGAVFVAEANCTVCGLFLVGRRAAGTPDIRWVNPAEGREEIA